MTGSTTTVAGFTCTVCGTFVLNGHWHSCGGTPQAAGHAVTLDRSQEIIDRLDQIIALLKKAGS